MDQIEEQKIASYQWLKIGQSVVLMVLGAVFFLTTWISKTALSSALSYALGAVLIVYGTLEIIAGYLLYRKPLNSPILFGLVAVSLAIVLFVDPELLHQILSVFLISFTYGAAVMMIVSSTDAFLKAGKNRKEIQKEQGKEETDFEFIKRKKKERMGNIRRGVVGILLSLLMIGFGSTYLFFYVNERNQVERYLVMAIGIVLFLLGIVSLVSIIKKVKNTKEMLAEEKLKQPIVTYNTSDVVKNTDVKVIDISELKRKRARRQIANKTPEKEKKVEKEEDKEEKQDQTSEKQNQTSSTVITIRSDGLDGD